MVFCNVNERVVIKSKEAGQSLFSEEIKDIETISQGMFSITCSGASLSKNKDLFAVGDFTGHLKVFKTVGGKFELLQEG